MRARFTRLGRKFTSRVFHVPHTSSIRKYAIWCCLVALCRAIMWRCILYFFRARGHRSHYGARGHRPLVRKSHMRL